MAASESALSTGEDGSPLDDLPALEKRCVIPILILDGSAMEAFKDSFICSTSKVSTVFTHSFISSTIVAGLSTLGRIIFGLNTIAKLCGVILLMFALNDTSAKNLLIK